MKTTDTAEGTTKERILDVAERMIAGHGVQQFSIRDITNEAGVNLAAINYHFGSKERLIAEVLVRRITELNRERMALLDEVEAAAGDAPPSIEAILEATIRPFLRSDEQERNQFGHTAKMLSRFFTDPDKEIALMLKPHFLPYKQRLVKLLCLALPGVSKEEVEWRSFQLFGVLNNHVLFMDMHCAHIGKSLNMKKELRRLVAFCSAGMRASADSSSMH